MPPTVFPEGNQFKVAESVICPVVVPMVDLITRGDLDSSIM
jgi:hypothetical protein